MTPTLRESPPATFQLTSSPAHFLENIHPGEEPKGMLVSSLVAPGQSLARLLAGNPQGRVTSAGAQRPDRSLKKAEWSGVAFLAPFLLFAYAVCQLKSLCPYFDSASLRRWGSQKKRGQTPVMYATQACEVRGGLTVWKLRAKIVTADQTRYKTRQNDGFLTHRTICTQPFMTRYCLFSSTPK